MTSRILPTRLARLHERVDEFVVPGSPLALALCLLVRDTVIEGIEFDHSNKLLRRAIWRLRYAVERDQLLEERDDLRKENPCS